MSIFDQAEFDACVLEFVGSSVIDQWESRVAKVGDKVFAILGRMGGETPHIVVKIDPGEFDFVSTLTGVRQAPYFAKRHWISITEGGALPDDEIRACIADSWALVAAKLTRKARAELGIALPG